MSAAVMTPAAAATRSPAQARRRDCRAPVVRSVRKARAHSTPATAATRNTQTLVWTTVRTAAARAIKNPHAIGARRRLAALYVSTSLRLNTSQAAASAAPLVAA
jgi:hypothetical protein